RPGHCRHTFGYGVTSALPALPADAIRAAVRKRFVKKGEKVVDANLKAFDVGVSVAAVFEPSYFKILDYTPGSPRLLMSGNEACAVAAVDAGCRFFAGYPITPSSEVLHFLSEWLPRVGGSCLQ